MLLIQGAIREVVEMLQREIVEGNLLKDCLEVGTDDLKGLVQIFKDIALKYAASSPGRLSCDLLKVCTI